MADHVPCWKGLRGIEHVFLDVWERFALRQMRCWAEYGHGWLPGTQRLCLISGPCMTLELHSRYNLDSRVMVPIMIRAVLTGISHFWREL
jgi:hypothetical protein